MDIILQSSESSPPLRHAAIALGAIHRYALQESQSNYIGQDQEVLQFAYHQYGEAVRQLRTHLHGQSPELVMLACILLIVFDFVQGDDLVAAAHLKGGLTILRNFVADTGLLRVPIKFSGQNNILGKQKDDSSAANDSFPPMCNSESLHQNLTKAFAYLDFWSLMWFDGESLFPEATLIDALTIEPMISEKEELGFQIRYLGILENRIYEFLRAVKARTSSREGKASMESFLVKKQDLIGRLLNWEHTISDLCSAERDKLDRGQTRRIRLALLNHKKIRLMLLASQEDGSSRYELFDSAFGDIVTMSMPLIHCTVFPQSQAQVFSFTPGILHPLYITAISCCHTWTCERAIELLQSVQWTEGAWNSKVMAKVAQRKLNKRVKR